MEEKVLKKMLKDFPWLWAIKSIWSSEEVWVWVEFASESMFDRFNKKTKEWEYEVWLKTSTSYGREEVSRVYIDFPPDKVKIARQIINTPCVSRSNLEFVVIVNYMAADSNKREVKIYRPPQKDNNFWSVFIPISSQGI